MKEEKELYALHKDIAEEFIIMIKNQYDMQLDFSRDSILILEKIVDKLKYITGESRESIKISMAAYVGQLLLTLFGGHWFQNDLGFVVCLKNTGFGESTEVFPIAWVEKRLSNGRAESIEFKIAVLTGVVIVEPSGNPQWLEDACLSEEYAKSLGVCISDKNHVDRLLRTILSKVKEDYIIDLDNVSKEALKYLRGRLIKLQDINVFNFKISDKLSDINKCFPKQKLIFVNYEFLALLKYLQDSPIDPNGGLLKSIWIVEKDSSYFIKSKGQNCTAALLWILRLIAKKKYHHDIIDFKKVINLINPENEEVIKFLSAYKLEYEQGCYKAIKYIMDYNFNKCLFSNFEVQRQIVKWLDNASGRSPQKPWKDKLSIIEQNCLSQDLSIVCQWIITHDELRYDEECPWLDSVFNRFRKSSKWYLNKEY